MAGQCPKCDGMVGRLVGDSLKVNVGGNEFDALAYECPLCNAILGCEIDPVSLHHLTVDAIMKALKSG
jgi:hypothetical protein